MLKIKKFFSENKFLKNIITLMSGTAAVQIIGIMVIPFLTRFYHVESFGIQALYLSVVGLLSIVSTGRYELAILLPKTHQEAAYIVILAGISSFTFSTLLAIVLFLSGEFLCNLFGLNIIVQWIYFMPLTLFVLSMYNVMSLWQNRLCAYSMIVKMGMCASIINSCIAIIYGWFGLGENGLLLYTFLGQGIVLLVVITMMIRKYHFFMVSVTRNELIRQAKRYIDCPKFLVIGHLFNAFSLQLPLFLLNSYFGAGVVGCFSMTQKFINMPLNLLATSVGNVFRQEASSEYAKKGKCPITYGKTFKLLALLGVAPCIIMIFFGPVIFEFFLGEQWSMAGEYSRYLALMFYMTFVSSPLSAMFLIAEKQKMDLCLQIVRIVLVYCFIAIGFNVFRNDVAVIIFYGISFCILHGMNLCFTSRWAGFWRKV